MDMNSVIKKKILIVDSDPEARQLLGFRLEVLGCEVLEASKPEEVANFLSCYPIPLVVTEWSIPGLHGMNLLKKLSPDEREIIVYTDTNLEAFQDELNQMKVKTVIPKRRRSELIKLVEAVLTGEKENTALDKSSQAKQILLVDDSNTIRSLVRRALEATNPGSVFREAEDGRSAISEMSKKKVDLIVTDLEMPGMDGRTFLRMIRRNPVLKQKPMLVLSGSITQDLLDEFKEDSKMLFIPKPSTNEVIQKSARRLLEGEKVLKNIS